MTQPTATLVQQHTRAAATAAIFKAASLQSKPSTPSCTSLLQLLLVRTLACIHPLFSSSISLLLTGIVSLVAAATTHYAFGRAVTKRIVAVAESTTSKHRNHRRVYSHQDTSCTLPPCVARYFHTVLQDGQRLVRFVCTKQQGTYRTTRAGVQGWRRVQGEQYYSVNEPGFVWSATIELVPMVWLRGWDSYVRGRGSLYWKLMSLFTVEHARGDDVDRSMLLRYLADSPCFPTALLPSHQITWEAIDNNSNAARCHLRDHGKHVSGVFEFDPVKGHVVRFVARDTPRGPMGGSHAEEMVWVRRYGGYGTVKGMQVPMELESCWVDASKAEEVPYVRMRLVDVGCFDSVHGGLS